MYLGGCCVHTMGCIVITDIAAVSVCLQGMPALQHAAYHQRADLVKLMLSLGADVHATYQVGNKCLSICVRTLMMSAGQVLPSDMLCL